MSRTIGVWAAGDPRARSTWSGTPAALVQALEDAGWEVLCGDGQIVGRLDRLVYGPTLVGGPGPGKFRHFWGYVHRRNVDAWRRFREQHPDLPVLHTDYTWLTPTLVGRHDFLYRDTGWGSWPRDQSLRDPLLSRIGARLAAVTAASAATFATSEWTRRELLQIGADPATSYVVGTGTSGVIEPYEGAKDYTNGRVLCVAKVRLQNKGVDILVDAFRLLEQRGSSATLDLVGPLPLEGLPSNVRVHGWLELDELRALFVGSLLYAMPAPAEPHGMVYLEAMMSRTPVLGSDRAAFPEFAGSGADARGWALADLTPASVADAIELALADPVQLDAMGRRGLAYAREHTWANVVSRVLEVVEPCSRSELRPHS